MKTTDQREGKTPPILTMKSELQALYDRWKQANERQHVAEVRGNAEGRATALAEQEEILTEVYSSRAAVVATFTFMLRIAMDERPDVVRLLLRDIIIDVLVEQLPAAVAVLTGKDGARG